MEIPELEFELGMAVLGGKFTTLEGLLQDIRELVSRVTAWLLLCVVGDGLGDCVSLVFGADSWGFLCLKADFRHLNVILDCKDKSMGNSDGNSQALTLETV